MRIAKTGEELLAICKEEGIKLSEYALRCEMQSKNLSKEEVFRKAFKNFRCYEKFSIRRKKRKGSLFS